MKVRCVYQLRNVLNGRHYIGSTGNFSQRKRRHFYDLERGAHRSRFMQRDFIKCGCNAFVIEILEQVVEDGDLLSREQHWIDATNPQYNSAKVAGSVLGVKHSIESIRMNSERNKGFGNGNARLTENHTNEIREMLNHMTIEQIAAQLGVERTTIQRFMRRVEIQKVGRIYCSSAKALFSINASANIAGRNALSVFVLRYGDGKPNSMPSITKVAQLLGLDVSTVAKRLKRDSLSFFGDFCISREPIDAAMVAWTYRSAK